MFDQPNVHYDVILRCNFLFPQNSTLLLFHSKIIEWHGHTVPSLIYVQADNLKYQMKDGYDEDIDTESDTFITEIKPSMYEKVDVAFLVSNSQSFLIMSTCKEVLLNDNFLLQIFSKILYGTVTVCSWILFSMIVQEKAEEQ